MLSLLKYSGIAAAFLSLWLLVRSLDWKSVLAGVKRRRPGPGVPLGPNRSASPRARPPAKPWMMAALGMAAGIGLTGGKFTDPTVWLTGGILAAAGYFFPELLTMIRRQRERAALEAQFPDALELIANSLRAGLSLLQALETAARELPVPIGSRFAEAARDTRLGLTADEALEKLWRRWPDPDLELFTVAAGVSRRTGSNLTEIAEQIAATVRERARLKGRIRSLTAQGKLSGWIVGLLPVGLLLGMSVLDPVMMADFFRSPIGWGLLAAGTALELIGAFVIRGIVRIDA